MEEAVTEYVLTTVTTGGGDDDDDDADGRGANVEVEDRATKVKATWETKEVATHSQSGHITVGP